jgi:hypothetical protein
MKAFVGVTDNGWFAFLSQQAEINEVNFLPEQSTIIPAGGALDM